MPLIGFPSLVVLNSVAKVWALVCKQAATRAAAGYSEGCPVIIRVNSMEEAVNAARANAVSGDIVSMSPASASFDMYKNFAEKGLHFKKLVNELK